MPSSPSPSSRPLRLLIAGGVLLLLVVGGAMLLAHLAAAPLQGRIAAALGPRATIESVSIGWSSVELRGLRLPAADVHGGWPAADELRAERVRVVPDLRSLWAGALGDAPWRVRRIEVHGGYLSMLRTANGHLRLLPSLLEASRSDHAPAVQIGEIRLAHSAIDLHDASLGRGAPHRVQLQQLDASIGPLRLPAADVPMAIELSALLKGSKQDGRITVVGMLTPSTQDAALQLRARDVDLVALQPYLLKAADAGVKSGRLDLDLNAVVERRRLRAPGTVTLRDLELTSGRGMLGSLAGVSRQAVLAALKRDGRIVVRFALDGRLDDPTFSLNESLAARIGGGLAESVGVSVAGVVEGVGGVIKGLFAR